MRRRRTRRVAMLGAAVAAGLIAASADAQSAGGRWELSLAGGLARPRQDGTYVVGYSPSLANHPEATGVGGQDLALQAANADAYGLSVAFRFTDTLSLRLLGLRHRSDLQGANSPYAVTLHYDARQPPDYQPRPTTYTDERAWPGTGGRLEQDTVALNLGVDLGSSAGLAYSLSGGVAAYRVKGEAEALGYTAFSEGGHGTLFADLHVVGVALEPAWAYGADLGGEVSAAVSPSLSVFLDGRVFWGRQVDLAPRVDRVLNASEIVAPLTTSQLQAAMGLRRVAVDPSFAAVTVGVRLRL